MLHVDARGDACPIPVVKTKNAIRELNGAGEVETLVDNEIAVQNLTKMAQQKGYGVRSEKRSADELCVTMTVGAAAAAAAAQAPAADHPLRLIFAGQVSVRKGVPYLLDAWCALGWRDAELWLIGGVTSDMAAIRSRWSGLEGVSFLGHSTALGELMAQGDLFVFPSIEEGSALVTYEAMACGLPVVTTPNAGSVARDGAEGYIVPIRDVDALCDRLQHLRANPALRAEMAHSARLRAAEFTWDVYRRKLLAAYKRILGGGAV